MKGAVREKNMGVYGTYQDAVEIEFSTEEFDMGQL